MSSFLKRNKDETIKEFVGANDLLIESSKEMEKNQKVYVDRANEKYKLLKEGTDKLMAPKDK